MFSSWYESFIADLWKPTQILILGLDNAGKTQILYCMKMKMAITNTMPTVGFNVEEFTYKNLTMKAWDLGGQTKFRTMWHHYYEHTDAVIFVIDSADRQRFTEAKKELDALLAHEHLRHLPFLIFANKQDLPQAAEITELRKSLQMDERNKTNMHIIACTASENHRITTGMDWLSSTII